MKLNAVVIPIYKLELSENEQDSLKQALLVLGRHPIVFVCSRELDVARYQALCNSTVTIQFARFNPHYFSSIHGYNQLLTSLSFYKTFAEYEYILIYQLDAWVFKDELDFWCIRGYDYIGAPWFESWHEATINHAMIEGGNGGFSLRRVASYVSVLKKIPVLLQITRWYYKLQLHRVMARKFYYRLFGFRYNEEAVRHIYERERANEDFFWTQLVSKVFDFKIAPAKESVGFGFEVNPSVLFEMNHQQLPFGCHAWEKYDKPFWSAFIRNKDQVR